MPDPGWLLSQLSNPRNVFDILVVALIIYWLLWVAQGTRATQLIRGIVTLLVVVFLVGTTFQLTALNWVLAQTWPVLLISLPVIFQPEIRRALEQLGRAGALIPRSTVISPNTRLAETIARAAQQLAERRFGALLVIERSTPLGEYASKGVAMDSLLSTELILSVFWPNSPLHDGAAIVHGDRLVAANVVLPLAQSPTVEHIGTRHRAAIGITEISDAIAVVVSEETGTISLANAGRMVRNLGEARLQKVLSILDRSSSALGPNGYRPPGLGRARDPREKTRDSRDKRDDDADSKSDAA
jgi:uncharacterized protein (TIGR00159 family)